jgi:hypothetical protein
MGEERLSFTVEGNQWLCVVVMEKAGDDERYVDAAARVRNNLYFF